MIEGEKVDIDFTVLLFIAICVWLVWFIGYPVYKKLIKKDYFDWGAYTVGLNVGALIINLINLLYNIVE